LATPQFRIQIDLIWDLFARLLSANLSA